MTRAPTAPPPFAVDGAAGVPLRLGPRAAFAAVRALFAGAAFDEPTVARRLGIAHLFGFARRRDGRETLAGAVDDANAALVRLLLDGDPLPAARTEALCGAAGVDALRALGVLVADAADPALLRATVVLAPLEGVWVAADLPPAGRRLDPRVDRHDIVFPPMSDLTREFLDVIPDAPGARVLELCAGSGMAALRAARRGAAEAWASDVAPRSVHFARFNARLNALDAVVVESDVWAALGGETFDRVYAHPPYVPALADVFDYRDAGEDGERVTRRIVEGLPVHLRRGGRCALTCALTDRAGAAAEARVRGWLGAAAAEFDLLVLQRRDWDAVTAYRNLAGGGDDFADCERWLRRFASLGIERFVLCSLELRRDALGRPPVTERRRVGPRVDAAGAEWLLERCRDQAARPDPRARVAGLRPRVVPGAHLQVAHVAGADGRWRAEGAMVGADYPALSAVKAPPLAPALLALCDGTRDAAALLAALRGPPAGAPTGAPTGAAADEVDAGELAALIDLLFTVGALEAEERPVPRPTR